MTEVKSTVVLSYIQEVSEPLRTVKSDTTLQSHLLRPRDSVETAKKMAWSTGFPASASNRESMQKRIKEHDRDIRLAPFSTGPRDRPLSNLKRD